MHREIWAASSYWAPLLSWLLAPLLAMGVPAATASDIMSVLIGLFALKGGRALVRTLGASGWLANVFDLALVAITLYCAMPFLSPDLLLAGILSWDFSIVLRRDYALRPSAGYLSGLLGGFAYFAKTYAFSFFVAHFVLVNIGHYLWADAPARAGMRRHLRNGFPRLHRAGGRVGRGYVREVSGGDAGDHGQVQLRHRGSRGARPSHPADRLRRRAQARQHERVGGSGGLLRGAVRARVLPQALVATWLGA